MNEAKVQGMFIEILRSVINDNGNNTSIKEKIEPEVIVPLYHLAKKHALAHILSHFIYANKIEIDPQIWKKLQREAFMSVYRCEQIKYSFSEICDALSKAGVSYIPLKGAILRQFYPTECMRTSCDIDILVHGEDLTKAIESLKSIEYKCGKRHYHDVSLFSPNNTHLELHFSIKENIEKLDTVLKDAWEYATLISDSRYEFTKEFFVFHIYAHMAYHFLSGGCGIRSLLDIWVMENKMNLPFSCAEELLKKAGIYQFASKMSDIANKCFSGGEIDSFSQLVLKYIFNGSVYGSIKNKIAAQNHKNNNSFVYAIKRLFMPYEVMTIVYPVLKKAPYLLPLFWIVRWVRAIFKGKCKRFINEVSCANNLPESYIEEVKEICSELGL